ncbi:MAG: hypothetical protein WDN06_14950 [Asticcacaulis sp.]
MSLEAAIAHPTDGGAGQPAQLLGLTPAHRPGQATDPDHGARRFDAPARA